MRRKDMLQVVGALRCIVHAVEQIASRKMATPRTFELLSCALDAANAIEDAVKKRPPAKKAKKSEAGNASKSA